MRKKVNKVLSYILVFVIMIGLIVPSISDDAFAADSLVYEGKISLYQASSGVGKFLINGKRAFCLQHTKLSPPSGTTLTSSFYDNDNIKKVLYYGWTGPAQWSGFKNYVGDTSVGYWKSTEECGIALTSLLLSCYYNGDKISSYTYLKGFSDFYNYVKSQPAVVNSRIAFDKESVKAYWDSDGTQRTELISIIGDSGASLSITLPSGVSLIKSTSSSKYTGTVTLNVGDKFYLKADASVRTTYSTGSVGKNWYLQPIIFKNDGSYQNLGNMTAIEDPLYKTSLTVNWTDLGSLEITKVGESGNAVSGATFSVKKRAV